MTNMTIKEMQDRIIFLHNAITELQMSRTLIGRDDDAFSEFHMTHTFPIGKLHEKCLKSSLRKADVTAILEEVESLAVSAVRAFYATYGAPDMTAIDRYIESVRELKLSLRAYIADVIHMIETEKKYGKQPETLTRENAEAYLAFCKHDSIINYDPSIPFTELAEIIRQHGFTGVCGGYAGPHTAKLSRERWAMNERGAIKIVPMNAEGVPLH